MDYKYFTKQLANGDVIAYAANVDETIMYKNGEETKMDYKEASECKRTIFDLRNGIDYDPISKEEFERLKAQK